MQTPTEVRDRNNRWRRARRPTRGEPMDCPRCGRSIIYRIFTVAKHKNPNGEWCA